jgi:hypothetical protein
LFSSRKILRQTPGNGRCLDRDNSTSNRVDSESDNSRQHLRLCAVEVRQARSALAVRRLNRDRVWIRCQQETGTGRSTCTTLLAFMLERMLAMLPLGWRPQWNSMLVRNINGSQYEIFSMLFLILGFRAIFWANRNKFPSQALYCRHKEYNL